MDSEKAGDANGDLEEFISFIVDLKTGALLWVHDCLIDGIAFHYKSTNHIYIIGKSWYIGHDGSEDYELLPNENFKTKIDSYFNCSNAPFADESSFFNIVEQVCELGSNVELKNIKTVDDYNEIYQKNIKTEKPEGFM